MAQLTPMMQQYMQIKEENPDVLLLYRLGDFYELFFDDAKIASKELGLVLTGRDCGLQERAPMCGVPFHAVDSYAAQLVNAGHRVAICDQLEDPKRTKGIVKRGITRILSPGTLTSPEMLNDKENSYIMSVVYDGHVYGISWCDVSTGQFFFRDMLSPSEFRNEIERLQPKEYLVPQADYRPADYPNASAMITPYGDWAFRRQNAREALQSHFSVVSLKSFDIDLVTAGVQAAGALIRYLHDSQKNSLAHITRLRPVRHEGVMTLDAAAVRNLELVRTVLSGTRKGSLLSLLDRTHTPGGARALKNAVLEPLCVRSDIEKRLDAVESLVSDQSLADACALALDEIKDLERILSRLSYGSTTVADCLAVRQALHALPALRGQLSSTKVEELRSLAGRIDDLPEMRTLLDDVIRDDATGPVTEGGIVKPGYSKELDELVALAEHGTEQLQAMEQEEREKTGIRTLRIKYNRVFGYAIEVSRAAASKVPDYYTRRQTLANAERYVTPALQELQEALLSASARRKELEYEIFRQVRDVLVEHVPELQQTAQAIAMLDVLLSFAVVSRENSYVRPEISTDGRIEITAGRHPVVERTVKEGFVPNDAQLGGQGPGMLLITGPNMAGKSTYMRQVGLTVLMAHIGCFVPASSATISIVDRIFTRIGASDDLASGQSTFMVEMNELANILNNATSDSLLLLDEVGRGTSTMDGLAIAQAAAEYIVTRIGAKTLFATHYHELTALGDRYTQIRNCSVAVKELGRDIVFLHRIVDGGTDRSFGIQVARLAGVPEEVLSRARKALAELQVRAPAQGSEMLQSEEKERADTGGSDLWSSIARRLESVNPDTLAPFEALSLIYELKRMTASETDEC